MTATLTKTQRILKRLPIASTAKAITFVQTDEDDLTKTTTVVTVLPDTWEDMGTPDTITVTIEPGDLLNDPENPL